MVYSVRDLFMNKRIMASPAIIRNEERTWEQVARKSDLLGFLNFELNEILYIVIIIRRCLQWIQVLERKKMVSSCHKTNNVLLLLRAISAYSHRDGVEVFRQRTVFRIAVFRHRIKEVN